MYFTVSWITCNGESWEEYFDFLADALEYADELRPHTRGTLRVWRSEPNCNQSAYTEEHMV
jgi:hypothetical protein